MKYPEHSDHPLITEAWRKAEQFRSEAEREQLLAPYRKFKAACWQYGVAHFLIRLALRVEPGLEQRLRPLTEARACLKSR